MLKSNYWFQTITLLQSEDQVTFHLMQFLLLTLSWRRPLLYRNQSIDLQRKWMDWFLYNNGLRHERVKECSDTCFSVIQTFTRLRHLSPQNGISLKEFETTTREIGLIIYRSKPAILVLNWIKQFFPVSIVRNTSKGLLLYIVSTRFPVQTFFWSLEFHH